ncbi:(ABC) transporter [Coemansia javaensis]|uniref:(ABC) transporter n=1 Tax=Coemansia javaensis TaxID=2761396 RepID=A0A9W8LGJ2_9FUNG|nr:(ABC) transporter [Coemansia javaensis]
MSAADKGTCPAGRCVSLDVDFRGPTALGAAAGQSAGADANATFVPDGPAGRISHESGKLELTLAQAASGSGYEGATVYFTRWIHYGAVSAVIRSGSTAPGVVSSFQLQSDDGSSIDMDWVGASSNRVQANFYVRHQLDPLQASAPILATDPTASFVEYKIVWLPDSLTWYANGLAVRTVHRQDTWAEGERRFSFPDRPARLSFSIWDAAESADPGLTQRWAGSIQGNGSSFTMAVESVSIQCHADFVAGDHRAPHGDRVASSTSSGLRSADSPLPVSTSGSDLGNFGFAPGAAAGAAGKGAATPGPGPPDDDLSRWLASVYTSSEARRANSGGSDAPQPPARPEYENKGTEYNVVIQRKDPPPEADRPQPATARDVPATNSAAGALSNSAAKADTQSYYGAFNIDNILDLMAGDDDGNVNFGAIGLEVANNLANVIDMGEVGNMATTLGMMLSGLGAVNEIQRQSGMPGAGRQNPNAAANLILNNGLATLLGQVLSNQAPERSQGPLSAAQLESLLLPGLGGGGGGGGGEESNILHNAIAAGLGSGPDAQQIANLVSGMLGSSTVDAQDARLGSSSADQTAKGGAGAGAGVAGILGGMMNGNGSRSIASAMADFVGGNDTANLSGIAQAIGIRNFFRTEDKKVPDGCPSCFNCMYPGSVCAHNATCNQFTGRCDCPSGWTGEDCLEPACLSPLDEGKRPASRSSHCHQDTECRPGWGGWNCNVCLSDSACDGLIPTGEGGRCYNGSELITSVTGQCTVGNKGLSRYLPDGVMPKMTFGCDRASSSCSAQFWISGKEAFYCDLDQCSIGTWGPKSTAAIDCRRMKCECIPGRFLCGNYGLDISSVLNEVEGPVDIKCHDHGFSDCYIRELVVSKTLASIIGDDAINMECSVGQCMHYSQLPGYTRKSNETSKSSMLVGVATSLLTVYFVLRLIRVLVQDRDTSTGGPSTVAAATAAAHPGKDVEPKERDGPSTGNEIDSILTGVQKTTVAFRDISYTIPARGPDVVALSALGIGPEPGGSGPAAEPGVETQVLGGVSGIVYPGELLAILGASGAGKSTLLDILSRREKCGKVTGKVLINDRDLMAGVTTEEFHRMSGYVDQQDLHVATATVFESVMTSALLRLPRTMSRAAKEKRVRQVLTELGLWSVRDSKIGKNGARGISGGEMRRVSIACELVTSPSIIFLDEPTSGLDAYSAYVVMDALSQMARRYGRTVICTIHQPRADIFGMFDRLIVLAAGQMCYSGPASDIAGYLESIGHPVPSGYNVADFSVDLVQRATIAGLGSQTRPDAGPGGGAESKRSAASSEPSDGEWSPLLASSQLSLSAGPGASMRGQARSDRGAAIYETNASLTQLLDSFADSPHHRRMLEKLDGATGADWVPTVFGMVASPGITPYARPVTPMQQVKVIFLNLCDLACILYWRLRGRQVTQHLDDKLRPTIYEQFTVLSARIFRNLYRDPTLMLANYALSLFIGLMCGVLFYQLDNSVQGVQNRLGLLMFVLAFYGFGCTTSLLVFSEERLLYLRERANAYYSPLAYFMAKVTFDLVPLRVIPPLLLTLIAYPMIGLAATWAQFIKFISTLVLFNLTVASQMFFIGLLAEELVVSNFLASIMLLFSLLFGGLILNKESIPAILQSLCRISSFNLAYEALAINELRHAHIEEVRFGLEIQVPTATLVSSFGFDLLAFWPDVIVLCGVLAASLGLSLLWLTHVIRERR